MTAQTKLWWGCVDILTSGNPYHFQVFTHSTDPSLLPRAALIVGPRVTRQEAKQAAAEKWREIQAVQRPEFPVSAP